MGMIDKLLEALNLTPEDDYDYDSEDDFDEEGGYEDTKPSRTRLFSGSKKEDDFDDDEFIPDLKASSKMSKQNKNKVVPMNGRKGMEVCVIKPISIDDAKEITDTLLTGKAVVLNLEGLQVDIAQRIIDYSAGSCYSIGGNLQKINNFIFLVTPANVDVSGDFQDLVTGGIDMSTFKG